MARYQASIVCISCLTDQFPKRTLMGDPGYVAGMVKYQSDMLSNDTAALIRSKISPYHTLNVSAYDPTLLDSLET
jgi:gamma-glutamyltranspeptidase / glutathione hydrolase